MKNYDRIPGNVGCHTVPYAGDYPGRLMAVNTRRRQEVMFDLLEIGVANPAAFHAHQNFISPDNGRFDRPNLDPAMADIDCRAHALRRGTYLIQPACCLIQY